MDEQAELPELSAIFNKIVLDHKDYCFVCLRTRDERRLLKPDNLINFVTATKIQAYVNPHFICYICERQVLNALQVFRAVVFASSLGVILTELKRRTITNDKLMLQKKYFRNLVLKLKMSSKLTPASVNHEVQIIRNNSKLFETDTLVMDNQKVYEAAATPTVVAITSSQARADTSEVFTDAIVQCPIERSATPCILPDRKSPLESILIDDDDDPIEPPKTQNTTQTRNTKCIQAVQNPHVNNNVVVTLEPPHLRTLSDILSEKIEKPKKFLLHPVFLNQYDELVVPSLSANILNGSLIFYNNKNQKIQHIELNVDTNILKENLKANREIFIQNSNCFNFEPVPDSNRPNAVVEKNKAVNSTHPQKKMKIDGSLLRGALVDAKEGSCSKVSTDSLVRGVQISDVRCHVSEQVNKSDGKSTDWEDKIPMDVISFMDAVDPNAEQVLSTPVPNCDNVQVQNVRSLAPHETKKTPDIIDLC